MVGGLIRGLVGISKHVLRDKESFRIGKIFFTLFAAMITGGLASIFTTGDWRISLLAGYAGSDLIESLYKAKLIE